MDLVQVAIDQLRKFLVQGPFHPLPAGDRLLEKQDRDDLQQWQSEQSGNQQRSWSGVWGRGCGRRAGRDRLQADRADADGEQTPRGSTHTEAQPQPDVMQHVVRSRANSRG